jgi:hypothetical protein
MSAILKATAEFQHTLLSRRVASRFAMEHATPEAREKYLHEHPNADPANHKVEKGEDKGSGEGAKKEEKGKAEPSLQNEDKTRKTVNRHDEHASNSINKLRKMTDQMRNAYGDPAKAKQVAKKFTDEHSKFLDLGQKVFDEVQEFSDRNIDHLSAPEKHFFKSITEDATKLHGQIKELRDRNKDLSEKEKPSGWDVQSLATDSEEAFATLHRVTAVLMSLTGPKK